MKATLSALFVALLMVGCGEDIKVPKMTQEEERRLFAKREKEKVIYVARKLGFVRFFSNTHIRGKRPLILPGTPTRLPIQNFQLQ